jgi:hypothetical protein
MLWAATIPYITFMATIQVSDRFVQEFVDHTMYVSGFAAIRHFPVAVNLR